MLTEVFTKELKKQINEHLHNLKYNVIISNNPSNIFTINGGLLIASKYKILKIDSINYKNKYGEDYFSDKGVLKIKVNIEGNIIDIYNTHLNADPVIGNSGNKTRLKQYQEFFEFIDKSVDNIIICGDFNENINSISYNKFINELNKIYPYTINKNGLCTFISTNECLDHILLFSKIIIDSTKNWTIKKKIINYSDHYPLFTKTYKFIHILFYLIYILFQSSHFVLFHLQLLLIVLPLLDQLYMFSLIVLIHLNFY